MAPVNGTIKRLVSDRGLGSSWPATGTSTSSTTPRAVKRVSTIFAKDRPSPSSEHRARRAREAKMWRSR